MFKHYLKQLFSFGSSIELEELDNYNDELLRNSYNPRDRENADKRIASKALTSGRLTDAIRMYSKMAEDYPHNKGLYLSQVGVAYFFLEEYQVAIDNYLLAMSCGFNRLMSDENIWEASLILYEKTKSKQPLIEYLNLFPDGIQKDKANRILRK